jgi:hypothetical protein
MFGNRIKSLAFAAGLALSLGGCYAPAGPYYGGAVVAPVAPVYYGGVYTGGYYGGYYHRPYGYGYGYHGYGYHGYRGGYAYRGGAYRGGYHGYRGGVYRR